MKKKLPVTITPTAFKKILEIRDRKQIDDTYLLRLGVNSSGCGIASYILGFDLPSDKDEVFEVDGLRIIMEKVQVMYLAGKSVDYGEADGETGFIFRDNT